ncbi:MULTISPECIES: RimK family alpha-L-glutamate ligase [Acidiplasma]|jgi:[lysine-biosynthesis-protein LysW]--L-2-aminoadipate ligase|uniref:Alpha-L-glutamate ligase n=2 Tax=Acidiplasma TaxID=507753 RepID=A0A0Q0VJ67_9ARCH|nr:MULTISPECIES: RimK family alpha-L-glutamate ligase [Acidiplasma]KJE49744.1 alpha-L-glutamate ligase [Acidiplasma sp. MBA-1]KPV46012.1 alpha-L-glutamate ligase [Acidiplasma aeolicum]KQB33559.1 alpha-L-glutamate ligase [Acidiplasma cupricumulans]KQB34768.1 alpha-L-glutamate ligase [Acidiplasma aeolicum]WMT55694.1 MAG: RimK family alpha-L-glutamate ligase [Acidiplasma sp.]
MKVSLVYDIMRWEEKSIMKALQDKNVEVMLKDVKNLNLNLVENNEEWGDISLQRSTGYYRNLHSTAYIEFTGHRILNDFNSTVITGNKMFTSLVLSHHGVKIPKSFVSFSKDVFLKSFNEDFHGTAVTKPVTGSWGRMISLLNDYYAAMDVMEYKDYMYPLYQINYTQEYINEFGRDLRVFVINNQVVAGIYRYKSGTDWRTNTALGGRAEALKITPEIEDIALKSAEAIGPGIYGIDILESRDGYFVNEINGNTEFKNTVPVTGVDIPAYIADYLILEARK